MLTRDGTRRYVIHSTSDVETALNRLHDLAELGEEAGYTDTGDLWEACNDLFTAITGGETLPGFDPLPEDL